MFSVDMEFLVLGEPNPMQNMHLRQLVASVGEGGRKL